MMLQSPPTSSRLLKKISGCCDFFSFSRLIGCNLNAMEQEAFIRLIKENEGIIYKVSTVYARDEEDRKDLYQEIVYQLWKSAGTFRGEAKQSTWLYRIALNTSITHLKRSKKRHHQVPIDEAVLNRIDAPEGFQEEQVTAFYQQIKLLNALEKGLVLLYLEGKSYDEMAEISGLSTSNVGTRLGRIKQKLKAKLQNV